MRGSELKVRDVIRGGGVVAAVCLSVVLAGCSEGSERVEIGGSAAPTTSPTAVSPSPTESSSSTPPPSGSATSADPGAPGDRQFTRGRNGAKDSDEQQEVAEAWYAFYEELVRAYTTPVADRGLFGQVATGKSLDGALKYAGELAEAGHRDVGGLVAGVTRVTVRGDEATVMGCLRSTMIRTDAGGRAMQEASPWSVTEELMVRTEGTWKVKQRYVDASVGCLL